MNSNLNITSSKPVKKMVIWTRDTNCKSTSPHIKSNSNNQKNKIPKISKSGKKEKENINSSPNEKTISSPSVKKKEITNYSNNRNSLNYTRITTNKVPNSQGGSFQSNSNEDEKNSSKINDSSNKKKEKEFKLTNNIKYKKKMNINYSPNAINTNNINSSEFHTNNTYKYFHSTNEMNLKKKENKANCITDNNIITGQTKKSNSKKKICMDKEQKKSSNSKRKISPNQNHQISPVSKNNLSNSINIYNNISSMSTNNNNNNSGNLTYAIFSQCKKNGNLIPNSQIKKNTYIEGKSENEMNSINNSSKNKKTIEKITDSKTKNNTINNTGFEKLKYLEEENKKLKNENHSLFQTNKELKILVNKLENEIVELKSVIKDNLNQFIQPQNDLVNKSYKQIMEQIEKQKANLTKILNNQKSNTSTEETDSKSKNDNKNQQKSNIYNAKNSYKLFKKNFFEFFNHVNTSNTTMNGYPTGSDPLKTILNSFCSFMDNIMNKIEEKFINSDKKENNKNKDNNIDNNSYMNYINNYIEICLINLYYECIIMQLFYVSFFERQHCYYCFSIIDYIMISPFVIIKNNNYIKEFSKKINNIIEVYKKINEDYINRFTEQNIFYLDNYIKLFNLVINNKTNINSNIQIDKEVFEKNTNILFGSNKQSKNIYLDMINNLFEKIQKNSLGNQSIEKLLEQNRNKGKNKVNMIKLTGDNYERISNISNSSSKIIDNYSEKPSFYGFLRSDDIPPDMSFGDEDL